MDEEITVTYDAKLGNGGLVGVTPVFAHTGVITASGGPGNWQYVQGDWGTFDSNTIMDPIGDDKHQITFIPKDFYGFPDNIDIVQFAFVFRNQDGSREGKTADLSDIFVDIQNPNTFSGKFIKPGQEQLVVNMGDAIEIEIFLTQEGSIKLFDNDVEIDQGSGTELAYTYNVVDGGNHVIHFEANNGVGQIEDSFSFVVLENNQTIINPPPGMKNGINKLNNGNLLLQLTAPFKEHVYLLSNLTEFKIDANFQMNIADDLETWWIEIPKPTDGNLMYQYLIDGSLRIADPYSSLILDGFNDSGIPSTLESVPVNYPQGLTNGHISYYDLEEEPFDWQVANFSAVENEDLVIYEIMMRDFLESRSFDDLIDTLSYLKKLGVNAIELMPVSEFENNQSWGYNVSYHMALDKAYGSRESFKRLVDKAHQLGIAVFLDIVYNHAFGQSPLVRMYWDATNSRPAENSPYFNPVAKHPYNVGFDFNHSTEYTKNYTKQTIDYWIEEFKVDGFRFDLSKGFTQNFSSNDSGFSAYDQDRIDILKEYGNHIWDNYPNKVLMLEHFATNTEEIVFSDDGFLLWGNANYNFNEATMGYNTGGNSNFSHIYYRTRGWNEPHLIGYMESHDEERLMYKNLQFGNSNSNYSVKNLATALERNAMAAAFFLSVPGPKLIWQFGELGYDYSINRCEDGSISTNCRLTPKPVRWDYHQESERSELFDVYSQMLLLRRTYPAFNGSTQYDQNVTGAVKTIHLLNSQGNAILVGNFDVVSQDIDLTFPNLNSWVDYLTGQQIVLSELTTEITLAPGEFHVYVDGETVSGIESITPLDIKISPNPATTNINISIGEKPKEEFDLIVFDSKGQVVMHDKLLNSDHNLIISDLISGTYYLSISGNIGQYYTTKKFVKQ